MNRRRSSVRWSRGRGLALALAGVLAGMACGEAPEGPQSAAGSAASLARDPTPRPSGEIRALLTQGDEAVRAGDWEAALAAYRDALARDSTVGAAWLGVAWAQEELGAEEAAAEARARLRSLAAPPPGDPHHDGAGESTSLPPGGGS